MTNPKHTDTSRSDDLVELLRRKCVEVMCVERDAHCAEAADRIEQLEREKAVVSDLWSQQTLLALDYLAEFNKAADRIEALTAENERLRGALELIRDPNNVYYAGEMRAFARAALGEKQ